MANQAVRLITSTRIAKSRNSSAGLRGAGCSGTGWVYSVLNSGLGKRCWAYEWFDAHRSTIRSIRLRIRPANQFIRRVLSGCERTFYQIRIFNWDSFDGIGWANACYCALVAVIAQVVPDLQVQRSVSERGTSFDAFTAPVAEFFINGILKERLFHKFSLDSSGGAELVFCAGIEIHRVRLEIAPAQVAIATKIIGVDTFNCRRGLDTFGSTATALGAFHGVDLPDILTRC